MRVALDRGGHGGPSDKSEAEKEQKPLIGEKKEGDPQVDEEFVVRKRPFAVWGGPWGKISSPSPQQSKKGGARKNNE